MAENLSYRENIDAELIMQIRAIARELPPACADFFSAIAVTTGTFTRLAYAIDLKTFFQFLQTERYQFSHKPLYAFTNEDLALVSQSDLTAYIEYLTFYYKSEPDGDAPVKALTTTICPSNASCVRSGHSMTICSRIAEFRQTLRRLCRCPRFTRSQFCGFLWKKRSECWNRLQLVTVLRHASKHGTN